MNKGKKYKRTEERRNRGTQEQMNTGTGTKEQKFKWTHEHKKTGTEKQSILCTEEQNLQMWSKEKLIQKFFEVNFTYGGTLKDPDDVTLFVCQLLNPSVSE